MTVVFIWFLSPTSLPIDTHSKYIYVYTKVWKGNWEMEEKNNKKTSGTKILNFVANCNDYKEVTLIYIQNIFLFPNSICILFKKKKNIYIVWK